MSEKLADLILDQLPGIFQTETRLESFDFLARLGQQLLPYYNNDKEKMNEDQSNIFRGVDVLLEAGVLRQDGFYYILSA